MNDSSTSATANSGQVADVGAQNSRVWPCTALFSKDGDRVK
jgi:hypothetical protein